MSVPPDGHPADADDATNPDPALAVTGGEGLADALRRLASAGFTAVFTAGPEGLRCGDCGVTSSPRRFKVELVERFEVDADPDDQAVLIALVCPACGATGSYTTAYGPVAPAPDAQALASLARPASRSR